MSPGSSSVIASFSFRTASRPVINNCSRSESVSDSAGLMQPPCGLSLSSAITKIPKEKTEGAECISTLPTMLLCHIKGFLLNKEILQLLRTGKTMQHEVQEMYRSRLRPEVAKMAISPMASYQIPVNRLPAFLGMTRDGEFMFQQCRSLKSSGLTNSEYRTAVMKALKTHLSASGNLRQLKDVFAGAALGMGGRFLSRGNRNTLLAGIFGSYATSSPQQMAAMIMGICVSGGRKNTVGELHKAVFNKTLAAAQNCTPAQMGAIIQGLCLVLGGKNMKEEVRPILIKKMIESSDTVSSQQITFMIYGLCLALGGAQMTAVNRNALLEQILNLYNPVGQLPLKQIMTALCKGLCNTSPTVTSVSMKSDHTVMDLSNRDAILAQILKRHEIWTPVEMGEACGVICKALGGMHMSPDYRDTVVAKILSAYATCTPGQLGSMIMAVCRVLGGTASGGSDITVDNLNAVLTLILKSHDTSTAMQMGMMFHCVFVALGRFRMYPSQRDAIVARIQESGRAQEIMVAIGLTANGNEIVDFLHSNFD